AARADDGRRSPDSPLAVAIQGCTPSLAEGVRQVLAIEVGPGLVEDRASEDACDRLTVSCQGASARVEATAKCGPPVERYVWLDELPPDAAPRAIALTGLELREAAKSAGDPARALKVPLAPLPATATAAAVPPSAPRARSASLAVAGTWQGFATPHGASGWGAALLSAAGFGSRWVWAGDLSWVFIARRAWDSGDIGAWLLSLGSWFGAEGAAGPLRFHGGLGARFGVARLSGRGSDAVEVQGATVWRPWMGPLVAAGVSWRVGRADIAVAAEIGHSLLTTHGLADGATVIAIGRTWVGGSLGGGFHW
ncbi:MAG TPA: hypothetical protein VIU64_19465, partial [Polyangia bacterium]